MNSVPPRFSLNIIREGKLLVCNDRNEIVDFREQMTMQYLDFKYFRDSYDSTFLNGIGYDGRAD